MSISRSATALDMIGLLTIDLQRDFLLPEGHPLGSRRKAYCMPSVKQLLSVARNQGWRVVHIGTRHDSDGSTLPRHLQNQGTEPFCIQGTAGAEFVAGLVEPEDSVLWKRSFSAFYGTALDDVLAGCRRVVICGVASDCCVSQTAFDAVVRHGLEVVIPLDGTSASDKHAHIHGLRTLAKSAASVLTTRDIIELAPEQWRSKAIAPDQLIRIAGDWYEGQQN